MAETKIVRISCSQIGEQYTHIQHKSGRQRNGGIQHHRSPVWYKIRFD